MMRILWKEEGPGQHLGWWHLYEEVSLAQNQSLLFYYKVIYHSCFNLVYLHPDLVPAQHLTNLALELQEVQLAMKLWEDFLFPSFFYPSQQKEHFGQVLFVVSFWIEWLI